LIFNFYQPKFSQSINKEAKTFMAIVKLSGDGQEIPLADAIAGNDQQLKAALTPFYPEMANAIIRRETDSAGQMVVTLTKQAGTKGSSQEGEVNPVLDYLGQQRQEINPAMRVAWKLQMLQASNQFELEDLVALQPKIEAALHQGELDESLLRQIRETLEAAPAEPAARPEYIPFGF
jgi:hypothetical protein